LKLTRNFVDLSNFQAVLLGGQARGNGRLAFNNSGSYLKAKFDSLDLAKVSDSIFKRTSTLNGKVTGDLTLDWPGLHFAAINGQIATNFQGSTKPTEHFQHPIPLQGELAGVFNPGSLNLNHANFTSRSTNISANGLIAQNLKLRVKLSSTDLAETNQLAEQA